jgi:spore maturation protein CgeB
MGQLGYQAIELTCKSFMENSSYIEKKINKMGFKSFEERYYQEWNKKLISLYYEYRPDLCLVLNGNFISLQTLELFKGNKTKLILWLIDSISRMPENEKNLFFYDKIFSFEHRDEKYLYDKYGITCSYSPVGYDPRLYYPNDNTIKDIDISFVGTPVAKRIEVLRPVAAYAQQHNKSLAAFGRFWDEKHFWKKNHFARKNNPLQFYVHNGNIPPQEVAQIYRRSKICLNIHVPDHEGVNPRTFEIMGTKSFQLVDIKPKMGQLLKLGKEIVEYENIDDLLCKIDYYLENNLLRENIAQHGCDAVNKNYTITHIVSKLIQ